jgi:hypothetical protein
LRRPNSIERCSFKSPMSIEMFCSSPRGWEF